MFNKKAVGVLFPLPIDTIYSYSVSAEQFVKARLGVRVIAPFGNRKLIGVIVDENQPASEELKELISIADELPVLTLKQLDFLRWISDYYFAPLGDVLNCAIPKVLISSRMILGEHVRSKIRFEKWLKLSESSTDLNLRGKTKELYDIISSKKQMPLEEAKTLLGYIDHAVRRLLLLGYIEIVPREKYRSPFAPSELKQDVPPTLNSYQQSAVEKITAAMDEERFTSFLLHGVTGSGKTEVYLHAIGFARSNGKCSLVLVPEISLTPQLVHRFRKRFNSGIAVLHSGLSEGERFDEWRRISRGEADIVIGARSALFAPLPGIGIIIVDEEHDGSYKQSEGVRYNARDMAVVLARMHSAVVVLGSATPLITSMYSSLSGKSSYLELPERANSPQMPEVTVIDMKGKYKQTFSPELSESLISNYAEKKQSLLFLNRRGFSTSLVCSSCGEVLSCPNCSVSLTYHQSKARAVCHYCDYSLKTPTICSKCGGGEFALLGRGTEKIEEEIRTLIPEAAIFRMDRDTTSSKGIYEKILNKMEKREIDILLGTQMVTKGHDFCGLSLVGVISADDSLSIPELWSAERTFQLVTQVLGRAGRGKIAGKVIIQAVATDHYAIETAVNHDYKGFYKEEIRYRHDTGYPPFSRMAMIRLSSLNESLLTDASVSASTLLKEIKKEYGIRCEILGPADSPLYRVRGRYRKQILLKASHSDIRICVKKFIDAYRHPSTVRVNIDIDPVDMM